MSDLLQRFLFEHTPVRGELVHLDATWRAVLERRDYPSVLKTLLGETMAAAALLSATLKYSGSMILQMQGNGPVKLIVVECTSEQTLRATAKWEGDIEPAPLPQLLGEGQFLITITAADGKQNYQGIVELDGENVAQVLEHYLANSEQIETRLWLAADTEQAAGMLLQKLPEHPAFNSDTWARAQHLGATITANELLRLPASEVIHRLFHEEDVRVFEAQPLSFRCSCSRDRVTSMLRMLGYDEVLSILREREIVEVDCEFCNRHYAFDKVDAEQIFAADVMTDAQPTKH